MHIIKLRCLQVRPSENESFASPVQHLILAQEKSRNVVSSEEKSSSCGRRNKSENKKLLLLMLVARL